MAFGRTLSNSVILETGVSVVGKEKDEIRAAGRGQVTRHRLNLHVIVRTREV